ncbi:unnamed protein product [Orchesella dallaii]|uniref:Uncharacterized protein n=1 Tax=Orchesella dallaii TaxID=48710 RepID=A0ABP1PZW7_9HEXA
MDGSDIDVDDSNAQGTVAANHEDNLSPNSDRSDSQTEASSSSVIFTAHAVNTDDTTFHELVLRNCYNFFPSDVVKGDPFYHDFVSPLFPVPDIVNQVFPLPPHVQDDNSSSDDSSSGSGSLGLDWDFINSISDDSDYDILIDEMIIPDSD